MEHIGHYAIVRLPHENAFTVINREDRNDMERFTSARAARDYALERCDLVEQLQAMEG